MAAIKHSFKEWEALIESPANALMVDCLIFGFPVGYEGPVLTPATDSHHVVLRHQCNVVAYVMAKVREGAMLGPFDALPFTPWCHVHTLFTQLKKDRWLSRFHAAQCSHLARLFVNCMLAAL